MRFLWIAAMAVPLSGCALPPIVTVATTALDFASYGETGKTVSDHALSFVLEQDCAVLRVFKGEICREPSLEEQAPTALAALDPMTDTMVALGPQDPMAVPADLAYLADVAGGALARPAETGTATALTRRSFLPERAAEAPLGTEDSFAGMGYLGADAKAAAPRQQLSEARYLTDELIPTVTF